MILTECQDKECDGRYIAVTYQGKGAHNMDYVKAICSKGHQHSIPVANAPPAHLKLVAEFPPKASEWFLVKDPDGSHPMIGCPKCGNAAAAKPPLHTVKEDTMVTPSFVCPCGGCGWHGYVFLDGWGEPPIWHVHLYEMKAKAEVELPAHSEKEAMEKALAMTKTGDVKFDQVPERQHMAVAFKGARNHLEKQEEKKVS